MITLEIPDRNLRMYLPEELSECDKNQYVAMSDLIYKYNKGKLDYEAFRIQAIYRLLNMKPVKSKYEQYEEDKLSNIHELSAVIDNYFELIDDTPVIKQYYIDNPVPTVKPLLSKYHGPFDQFSNMSFGEYIDGLNFFINYHHSQDVEDLYMLMAIFYRKKKPFHFIRKRLMSYNGDIRSEYNTSFTTRRAKKFKLLPFGEVFGFYLLFASFQKYLASARIYWQGKELDLSILFSDTDSEEGESDIPGIGMKSVEYTLAESGVFGTIKEIRKENFWEIIIRMYDLRKRDLDYKAKEKAEQTKTP